MSSSDRQQHSHRVPGSGGRPGLPPGPGPTVPSIARTWDFLLGGKDNYLADREQAARLIRVVPDLVALARESRAFTGRAVTWLAGMQGIGQFIDLGCGLPGTSPGVHQVVAAVRPGARAAYVDSDPAVVVHAKALLAGQPGIAALHGDIREPLAVLGSAELRQVVDLSQSAGVVAGMILHFLPGDQARRACAQLTAALAPGSYLVASVGTGPAGTGQQAAAAYQAGTLHRHTAQDIAGFLGGLELVPPGIVHAGDWSPGRRRWIRHACWPPSGAWREGEAAGGSQQNTGTVPVRAASRDGRQASRPGRLPAGHGRGPRPGRQRRHPGRRPGTQHH
jgi:hypothetical protein